MLRSRRRAFTLFHLLVLLALLALLFAMLLPAVARVREQALRTQSVNNLHQLALACHNYHDTNGAFPPGVDAQHFSAAARLLPYIEQANVFNLIDFSKFCDDRANARARALRIKIFLNPLDSVPQTDMDAGPTNYVFCAGDKYDLKDNTGVFSLDSKLTLPQIANGDGTSNTIMIGETLRGDGMARAVSVKRQHVRLTKADLKDLNDDSGVKDFKDGKHIAADRCASWIDGRFLQGTFTATRAVNDERPDVDCEGAGGLAGLRSNRDGANVAMCDGSTRYLTDKIELKVLKALATWNGGEAIPNF
jgi:prepilin-type processing-associated H-X9-DG protein